MAHWSGIGIPKTNAIALEVSYTHTHNPWLLLLLLLLQLLCFKSGAANGHNFSPITIRSNHFFVASTFCVAIVSFLLRCCSQEERVVGDEEQHVENDLDVKG